jgi:hypothetical protein
MLMDSLFPGHGTAIVAHYPSKSFPTPKDAAAEAFDDGAFVCPTRRAARALTKGRTSAFLYQFVHAVNPGVFQGLGVFHSSDRGAHEPIDEPAVADHVRGETTSRAEAFMMCSRRSWASIAIGIACLLAAPAGAHAQSCIQWSANGTFKIWQSNGIRVIFVLSQEGEDISGIANYSGGSGSVEGFITRTGRLHLTVTWNNGSVGIYTGFVDDDGDVVDGRTYDRIHPESWATWQNTTSLTCVYRTRRPG